MLRETTVINSEKIMNSAFLSFNRDDRETAMSLRAALEARNITVSTFPPDFYGQKGWPQRAGESIARHADTVVLWSAHAAISHIIEFEFRMAMLLQRRILVVRLDRSPLRSHLRATVSFRFDNEAGKTTERIAGILATPHAVAEPEAVDAVLKKLSRFNETKPAQVIRKFGIVYEKSRIDNPRIRI